MFEFMQDITGTKKMTADAVKEKYDECGLALAKIEEVGNRCGKKAVCKDAMKKELTDLKRETGIGDTKWPSVWEDKQENEKKALFSRLQGLQKVLCALNRKDFIWGITIAALVAFAFLATVGLYFYLHLYAPGVKAAGERTEGKISVKTVDEISKELRSLEVWATKYSAAEDVRQKSDIQKSMLGSFQKFKILIAPLSNRLSTETSQQISAVEAEIALNAVDKISVANLQKRINTRVVNLQADFFWTSIPKKWLEIGFWSLWGTFVGILFYIGGLLNSGIFHVNKIPMMAIEILITPIVVLVIFFLFPFTEMTAITPADSSIHMILGLSFILGFSIRRTVGLIDNVKKRIFPNP